MLVLRHMSMTMLCTLTSPELHSCTVTVSVISRDVEAHESAQAHGSILNDANTASS